MNERQIRIGNRISGLLMIAFGGIVASSLNPITIAGGSLLIAEGVGDLTSGEHHYLGSRALRYIGHKVGIKFADDEYNKTTER